MSAKKNNTAAVIMVADIGPTPAVWPNRSCSVSVPEKTRRKPPNQQSGYMRLHQNLTMIEVGDPKLLDTVIAAGSMGQWIVDRPTPELLFVDSDRADDVLAVIRRSGLRPRVVDR